jgi:hypothetical protein
VHDRFKKLDDANMREYSEEVDTVLVFVRSLDSSMFNANTLTSKIQAGLFSAILTAFIVEVYKGLQEDPVETSARLLLRITMQLENSNPNFSSSSCASSLIRDDRRC